MSIAGIALLLLGVFLLIRGGSFTTQRDVVKVGDVKLTANERQSIPPVGGGARDHRGVGPVDRRDAPARLSGAVIGLS
jgi:hypothetical protein